MLNLPHALDDFVEPVLHVQEQIVPAFRQGCHQACTGITDTGLGMRQGVELDELFHPKPLQDSAGNPQALLLTDHSIDGAEEHGSLGGRRSLSQVLHDQGSVAEDIDELSQVG